MARNLEIKVRVPSLRTPLAVCRRLHAKRAGTLAQKDTYFNVRDGRLKLREIRGKVSELIYYRRTNRKGKRYSDYVVIPLKGSEGVKSLCRLLFGTRAIVRKDRILFLYKNARIHLDTVARLGSFVEFEVLVLHGNEQAERLMDFLVLAFGVVREASVASSYVDLMLKRRRGK